MTREHYEATKGNRSAIVEQALGLLLGENDKSQQRNKMGSNATRVRWAQERLKSNPGAADRLKAAISKSGKNPDEFVTLQTSVSGNQRTVGTTITATIADFYAAKLQYPDASFGVDASELPYEVRKEISQL